MQAAKGTDYRICFNLSPKWGVKNFFHLSHSVTKKDLGASEIILNNNHGQRNINWYINKKIWIIFTESKVRRKHFNL